jgi:protein SCO1/2/putative membrane protein
MKEFAGIWGARPDRWLFLTGTSDQVWKLIREGFKVAAWENVGTERLPGMEFAHSNHLIHVDSDGRILGRYDSGVDAELTTLKRVLKGDISTPLKHQPATQDALAALRARQAEAAVETSAPPADPLEKLPAWARRLPALNALLNGLASVLLLFGFGAIKLGKIRAHKRSMLTAFFVSVVFLASYVTYHYALHEFAGIRGKPFPGTGLIRSIYLGILFSHVILAATVPVLAIISIRTGLKAWPAGASLELLAERQAERRRHRRWATITFPIWLYVSVTGVIIYLMLYKL